MISLFFIILLIFPVPKAVIANFHLGNFPAEHFLVDKQGCKIFKHYGLVSESDENGKSDECMYKNITILSRLGREFRLEQEINKEETVIFNIPKQHVLSWSVTKPRPKEKKSDTKLK